MSDGEQDRLDAPWGLLVLFAAPIVFDLLIPILFPLADPLSPVILAVYIGFLLAQFGLHAALVVLWKGWLGVRMASILVATALAILQVSQYLRALQDLSSVFVVQWVLIAVAMLGLGVMGWELQRWTPQQLATIRPRPIQISLLGLGILVTVVCMLAAIANQIGSGVGSLLLFAGLLAMQTVVLIAAVLTSRQVIPQVFLGLAIALSVSGAWFLFGYSQGWNQDWLPILLLFMLPVLFQALVLLAMRFAGYRLWRLGPNASELQIRRDAAAARVVRAIAPSPFLDSAEAQKNGPIADPNG